MTTRIALALVLAAGAAASAQTITVVAPPLGAAPGVPGAFFRTNDFDNPIIDDSGHVAFRTRMVQNGTTVTAFNDRGLWYGSPGALVLVLRGGDQAPDLAAGVTLNNAANAGLNGDVHMASNGRLVIGSPLAGPGIFTTGTNPLANATALFGGFPGDMHKLLQQADPAPGTGFFFNSSMSLSQQSLVVNSSGAVCVKRGFNDTNTLTNDGQFAGQPDALTLIARKGDTPGGPGTAAFAAFTSTFYNVINASGQVAFDAKYVVDATLAQPVTTFNESSLWIYTPGQGLTQVVREGDPAPGTSGATFNAQNAGAIFAGWNPSMGPANFNNGGDMLFQAEMYNGDVVGTTNNLGLFLWHAGALTMVSRRGNPAPGTDGLLGVMTNTSVCLNNNGNMFAWGSIADAGLNTVTAANDFGMWMGSPSNMQLVLREGDPLPGFTDVFYGGTAFGSPMLNNQDVAIVNISLTGAGTTAGVDDKAVFALHAGSPPLLLARSGQRIEVAPGDARAISSFGWIQFSNGNGGNLSYNDTGTFAVRFIFADSTQCVAVMQIPIGNACYANCDNSSTPPLLNINDFICFQSRFAAGDSYANCDGSTTAPILNINDFICFQSAFASGCQ